MLSGTSFDICLEYKEEKEISLTEAIETKQGNFDKGSIWDDPSKYVPQDFKYKYSLGGLTIFTNTQGFATNLKPTEESVKSDFNKVWSEIDIEDGISKEEFKKLKSIASCASKYLTANQRYNLLAALVPNNNNIIESREDLILDLFETSTYREDLNEFVGLLKEDTKLFEKLFAQIDDITYDFWHNENNKTRLLNTLYSIWSLSEESNIANHTYTNENPLIFYYNEGGVFRRTFSIEKGEFRFSGGNICERKYIDDEGYTQDKCYNIFQPIRVIYEEDEIIKLPSKDVPAFYLMGVHNLENLKARMTSLSFTVDAISLVAAGGGLTKLKDLSKAYKLARVFISGVEIGSTVVDMVLNYTSACDGNSEFCNKLQAYNFWLQMATLSSDIVVSKMAKKAAKDVLNVADETLPNNIRKHLEEVSELSNSARKIIYPNVKINGATVVRILEGKNGKIALMGRKMTYIEEVAKGLEKLGKKVEIFDVKKAFGGKGYKDWELIKKDWDDAIRKHGVLDAYQNKVLPYDKVKKTMWYKENLRWAKWIKEEGFEIYDLGDNPGLLTNTPDRSAFYDIEKLIIFND